MLINIAIFFFIIIIIFFTIFKIILLLCGCCDGHLYFIQYTHWRVSQAGGLWVDRKLIIN